MAAPVPPTMTIFCPNFAFPSKTSNRETTKGLSLPGMDLSGTAPVAMINVETEPIIAVGCVLAEIPLIDKLNENPVSTIKSGDFVRVLADEGSVKIDRL